MKKRFWYYGKRKEEETMLNFEFTDSYEDQYMSILKEIYENGFSDGTNERTGHETKRLPGVVMRIDLQKEFPILKSKFVAGKTALREIEWIWKQNSNNIHDLKAHIWDEWADESGSIGSAYGYQVGKPVKIYADPVHHDLYREYHTQAEFIIEYLKEFPQGRWGVVTLWNVSELSEMRLVPCCHTSTWNLDGGRLNCVLDQRSGDFPYGVPFNTTQYAELCMMLAKELDVEPGILTHVIADAHIYDNQMEGVKMQIQLYNLMQQVQRKCVRDIVKYTVSSRDCHMSKDVSTIDALLHMYPSEKLKDILDVDMDAYANYIADEIQKAIDSRYVDSSFINQFQTSRDYLNHVIDVLNTKPKFVIHSDKGFFDYTADDCEITDYKYMAKISFGDVAV